MDIQFAQLLDLVPLKEVLPFQGEVPALDIRGTDFSKVVTVYLNGIPSPDIVPVTQTRLIVQIPDSLVGISINTIEVFSSGLILTERTKVVFTLEKNLKVGGFMRLIQYFVKMLLQGPNTDTFDSAGGGMLKMVGSVFTDRQESMEARVRSAVDNTARVVSTRQQRDPRIPLDERLLSADVVGVKAVPKTGQVNARIALRNQTGQVGMAAVAAEAG